MGLAAAISQEGSGETAARGGSGTQSRRLFTPAPRLPPPLVVTVYGGLRRPCHADTAQLLRSAPGKTEVPAQFPGGGCQGRIDLRGRLDLFGVSANVAKNKVGKNDIFDCHETNKWRIIDQIVTGLLCATLS